MPKITVKFKGDPVLRLMKVLNKWAERGIAVSMKKISERLAKKYKAMIRSGNEPDKRSAPLDASTMVLPLRAGDKGSPIRGDVNSSPTPLVATGRMVNSIKSKKINDHRSVQYVIHSNSKHGNDVLEANEGGRANWKHRGGKIRDPLRVTDKEVGFIADELVKDLDRTLRKGF